MHGRLLVLLRDWLVLLWGWLVLLWGWLVLLWDWLVLLRDWLVLLRDWLVLLRGRGLWSHMHGWRRSVLAGEGQKHDIIIHSLSRTTFSHHH